MILFEYQVHDLLQTFRSAAERMRSKIRTALDYDALYDDALNLKRLRDELATMLPDEMKTPDLNRHLGFLESNLRDRSPLSSFQSDIDDICLRDIPRLEKAFTEWASSQQHFDSEFAEKVRLLVLQQHLDSAVRKAFVILNERLVSTFSLPDDLDGPDLVNGAFGQKGVMAGKIPADECEAMRNLLSGLYGAFRNRYSHHDIVADWFEADAVLSMINWSLKRLDKYASIFRLVQEKL